MYRVSKILGFVLTVVFLAGGCATRSDGFFPPLKNIRLAAVTAAKDPNVWIPTLAAAAVTVGNLDNKIAEDAREHQRLFSDPQGSSDDLRDLSAGFYLLTALADRDTSVADKGLKFGKDVVSIASAHVLTSGLKTAVGRERPGMDNHESFPSGHGTRLGGLSYLTNRNLANLRLPNGVRMAGTLTNYGIATAGAWARVEAGKHHPSDVLFGFAFGHFTTQFVRNAFFSPDRVAVSYEALPEGGAITIGLRF
ncbi:MAG: phosphatase PAP2 family protein [Pseudomonadales bacterium]|nr:phosphatase PAP2 family protein [Pseudomonadales bacterium]